MTKKELLERLKSDCFYRAYLTKATTKEMILQALKHCQKGFAPLYKIDKIGSNYRYSYTHKENASIHYHGQLKGCEIEEIKEGVYTIDFYYNNDEGQKINTAKVLYIMQSAI